MQVDGIPNDSAASMSSAVAEAIRSANVAVAIANLKEAVKPVVKWATDVMSKCNVQLARNGWLTREFVKTVGASKPMGLEKLLAEPAIESYLQTQTKEIKGAVAWWRSPGDDDGNALSHCPRSGNFHLSKKRPDIGQFFQVP